MTDLPPDNALASPETPPVEAPVTPPEGARAPETPPALDFVTCKGTRAPNKAGPKKKGAKPKIVQLPPLVISQPPVTPEQTLVVAPQETALTTTVSSMSPEVIAAIEEGISAGLAVHRACSRAGISHDTYENWRKANPSLAKRFTTVDSEAEFRTVRALEENAAAGNRCWTAYSWKLERRYGWHLKTENKTTTDVNLTISKELIQRMGSAGDTQIRRVNAVNVEAKQIDVS